MEACKKNIIILIFCVIHFIQSVAEMTQSEAHLSIPQNKTLVDEWYNMEKNPYYKQLYDQAVAKEKLYNTSHYVFYTGFINEWRIPQDLYLKLYIKLYPLAINLENLKYYRAFRWIPVDYQTPKDFLKKELTESGLVRDSEFRIKAFLLSTNLAFFGNVGFPGECTFTYFLTAKSHGTTNDNVFKSILDIFDDPTGYKEGEKPMLYKYIPNITKLRDYMEPEPFTDSDQKTYRPQTISQIFIPKSLVDQVAYLAWVQGVPFDATLVNWMMTDLAITPGQSLKGVRSATWLKGVRTLFQDKQTSHPLFKQLLQGIEEGKYSIAKALEEYKSTPHLVPGLNYLQARLMIMPDYINVGAGIRVFDYDRISETNKKKYENELNKIIDDIFKDIVTRAKSLRSLTMPTTSVTKTSTNPIINATEEINKMIDNATTMQEKKIKESLIKQSDRDKLLYAVSSRVQKIEEIKALIAKGISAKNLNLPNGVPSLFVAINRGNAEIVEQLLTGGADIDKIYEIHGIKIRPIDYAIALENATIVNTLIQNGARILKPTRELANFINNKEIRDMIPKTAVK